MGKSANSSILRGLQQPAHHIAHARPCAEALPTEEPLQPAGDLRARASLSLRGSLASVAVLPLLRFLADLGKSGRLCLARDAWQGEVVFDRGRVLAATVGDEHGLAALEFLVLAFVEGDFAFSPETPSGAHIGEAEGFEPWARLEQLSAACRGAAAALPGPAAVPRGIEAPGALGETELDTEVTLDRATLAILAEVDGQRTFAEIAARCGLTRSAKALLRLVELDLITFDAPPAWTASADARLHVAEPTIAEPAPGPGLPPRPARRDASAATWRPRWARPRVPAHVRSLVARLMFIGVLAVGLRLVVQNFHVQGTSMAPSLADGEFVLINRAAYFHVEGMPFSGLLPTTAQGSIRYLFGGPQRGDVAVFAAPPEPGKDFIKRIIGLPGDRVLIQSGRVFVNGQPLTENYVRFGSFYTYPSTAQPVIVPDDSYFVLGDNRPVSLDSHFGWFVPADNLVGRASVTTWPPAVWGVVPQPAVLPALSPNQGVAALMPSTDVPDVEMGALPAAAPSEVVVSTPTPTAPALQAVLDERFTDRQPGWPDDRQGLAWFGDGAYQLFARQPSRFVALRAPIAGALRDVVVTGTFRKLGGPPGGGYGLIVRDQGPDPREADTQERHFYVAEVGDRGEVGIWRRAGDQWVDVLPWTPSAAVRPGAASNDLSVRAIGDRLTFLVNGSEVASQTGIGLGAGGVGVFVGGDFNQAALERLLVQAPT